MTLPVEKPAIGSTLWQQKYWNLVDVVNGIEERIRDVMEAALVGGTGLEVVVNDAGDTITINNTALGDAESIQDLMSTTLVEGTNTTITYDDEAGTITISSSGSGGGLDAEAVRDTIGTALTEGTGIDITVSDGSDTITIATTITQYTDALARATYQRVVALTDGATITPDADTTDVGKVTIAGNRTMAAPSGTPVAGQKLILRIKQDGTGSRTITWNSAYRFSGAAAPALTTTASKTDYLGFIYNLDDTKWDCVAFKANF